jgi:acyl carrier protein
MPDRESLRAKLVALLEEEMGESYALPEDDQDLRETLGLDSVDLVGLVMRIEREFHVRLAPEELALVKRVGDLLDLMESKLAGRAHQVSSGAAGAGEGTG